MPKKKHFVQQSASKPKAGAAAGKKKQPPDPETEVDFLDLADEHEKAAGKWRAGDAAKSTRFFQRAIDAYAAGLSKYPTSFDLAYNKALLEYEITQDARIAREFKHSRIDMLKQTLDSHLIASKLNPQNVDVRFNTAQVMSDLAEALEEANEGAGVDLYLEGIRVMAQVFDDQEKEYATWQAAIEIANGPLSPETRDALESWTSPFASEDAASSSKEYATVEEIVTERGILDTIFSLSGMVSDLMLILPPERYGEVASIAERTSKIYSTNYLDKYIDKLSRTRPEPAPPSLSLTIGAERPKPQPPPLSPWEEASREFALCRAIFTCAYADMHSRQGDPETTPHLRYYYILYFFSKIYSFPSLANGPAPQIVPPTPTFPPTADGVCAYADALLDLVDAIAPTAEARRANEEQYIIDCNDGKFKSIDQTTISARTSPATPLDPPVMENPSCVSSLPLQDLYMDALSRALTLLTAVAPELIEREKAHSPLITAGDVLWRLRNAHLAFLDSAATSSLSASYWRFDLAGAYCCEMRAVEFWMLGANQADRVLCRDVEPEYREAKAKICISNFARGGRCDDAEFGIEMCRVDLRRTLTDMVKDGLIAEKVLRMADGVGWF
ncbi:hypothetical protein IWX49DRAFT_575545 [Phyllosticta citricarpa]|uniref:Uncharacterized protein n=2 Tax=Phyllosticta TaxID=121621 RepID=A0ABR1M828_9PEZI